MTATARYLLPEAVAELRSLAQAAGTTVRFERVPLDSWRAEQPARPTCWAFADRDPREVASEAARAAGKCVICGTPTDGSGAATCRSVPCLKRWLLPAGALKEAAALALATDPERNGSP